MYHLYLNQFLFFSQQWHAQQVTPVSLGCDAQADNVFPCCAINEVIVWLLLLVIQKLRTANTGGIGNANTCGIGKRFPALSGQETKGSREHEGGKKKPKTKNNPQREGPKLKNNSSTLKCNYKCQCMR